MKIMTKNVKVKGVVVGTYQIQKPTTAEEWRDIAAKTTLRGKTVSGQDVTLAVDSWDAWYYGAGLKIAAQVKATALEGVVTDHKLNVGKGKVVDLDSLTPAQGIGAVNALRNAATLGLANDKVIAKANHYAAGLVDKGLAHEKDGMLVSGKNGAPRK